MKLKREYSIALIVLGALGLLIFGVNFLKGLNLFEGRNVYHAVYADVSGVTGSSPVFYRGLKVGQVVGTQLLPDGSGRIAVSFQVDNEHLRLPRDSKVQIYSADLFTRALQVLPGTSTELAAKGDTLQGDAELSLTDAVGQQIDPLKRKAEGMLASVDSVLTALNDVLNPSTVGDIDSSFTSVRRTLETLEGTARRIDALVAAESAVMHATLGNIQQLSATMADNRDELSRIFSNLDTLTAALASGRIDRALENMAVASDKMKALMARLESGEGTMGKLMSNDSLYNNLNAASAELDLLLEDLRVNPNRYFSVFGKKDRLPKLSDADIQRIQRSMQEQR